MVPMTVCSGGLGTISEVKADVEEDIKPSTSEGNPARGPLMNNGGRDLFNTNDIQKLQQQLQDIKEQVRIFELPILKTLYLLQIGTYWCIYPFSEIFMNTNCLLRLEDIFLVPCFI